VPRLLFALFLAVPPLALAAAPGEQRPANRSADIRKELNGQMLELTAMLQKLQEAGAGYQKGDPVARVEERAALREDVARRAARLSAGLGYFRQFRTLDEAQLFDSTEFEKDVAASVKTAEDMLALDAKAFASARRSHRIRTMLLLWGALLALLGLLYLAWRKSERLLRLLRIRFAAPPAGRQEAAPEAVSTFVPGSIFQGTYRIEKDIGQGGMARVYEATDMNLDRKVAIKVMREELFKSGVEPELFLNEARMVASLKHPNIVEIHSVIRQGDQIFLVFEYVFGQPLSRVLLGGKRISLRSTKLLLRQIAAALDFAHCRKIVHRDLKPGNIMITNEGTAKVMDFGIAHVAQVTAATASRTDICGTPPYMAPEQELGVVSRESDIFSLGVVLYEMLTGRLPYEGPDYLAEKEAMRYALPSKVIANLPKQVDDVLQTALQFDPRLRFHSATELFTALETVQ